MTNKESGEARLDEKATTWFVLEVWMALERLPGPARRRTLFWYAERAGVAITPPTRSQLIDVVRR